MNQPPMHQPPIGLVFLALLASCGGGPQKASEFPSAGSGLQSQTEPAPTPLGGDPEFLAAEPVPAPWTQAFVQPATLLADRIRIEGPHGLFDHLVVRSDDEFFLRTAETKPEGLLQVTRPRPSADVERVGGQLDRWQLSAFEGITVLINPALQSVRVIAEGDAFWRTPDGTEKRGARLVFDEPVQLP